MQKGRRAKIGILNAKDEGTGVIKPLKIRWKKREKEKQNPRTERVEYPRGKKQH